MPLTHAHTHTHKMHLSSYGTKSIQTLTIVLTIILILSSPIVTDGRKNAKVKAGMGSFLHEE